MGEQSSTSTATTTTTKSKQKDQKDKIKYSTLNSPKPWEPGVWKRLPWLGILSLVGVILCLAFNIAILVIANKQPTSEWKIQPSVLLAISSAASNGLLRFAMAEGAVIAWWTKAMSGCTVHDLHRYWTTATSIFVSIRDIKYFNVMTLACIASVVIAIDNPLFQRALMISVQSFTKDVAMSVAIAQIPEGYTGIQQGKASPVLSGMSPAFEEVMKGYSSRDAMHLHNSGCGSGNCSGIIRAAGFAVDCTRESFPYDFGSIFYDENGNPAGSDHTGPGTGMQDVTRTTFTSNFTFNPDPQTSTINFTVSYKDQSPCKSRLQVNRCSFKPATLNYPVIIENGTVAFSSSLSGLGTTERG